MRDILAERVKTWSDEWKAEGLRGGRKEGEANLMRRQLVWRFGELPDWVDGRAGEAGEAELESWAELVLDAGRLEDVFADRR